ncbi:hypothetical protein RGQ29_030668 [Quercus rubra]|uniref:Uncharacterized protein n=1 Tax=Quercus rubra TaxID=3512 RepID=A0AAN7IHP4_QUERU|nr:hypothetical protein RGQ29_030668 [Quercus rubra]
MALNLLASLPICNFSRLPPIPSKGPISLVKSRSGIVVQCMPASKISNRSTTLRRSANYQPSDWHYDFIQSLRNEYTGESCTRQNNMLKEQVRMMLHKVVDPLEQLELIDILQRLGISYHFEGEIKRILEGLYNNIDHGSDTKTWKTKNLYATALKFRLLRQHGYIVSQEVFNSFMDERGNFKACLCEDTKGMLSLYEASFLSIENENILEDAREFSTKHLKVYVKKNKDKNLSALVSHSLKVPLHWRMLRLEARWFIDIYRRREDMNTILLELAELDFNMVQATHQEDLKELSRSWKSTGLAENLNFVRDRPLECFLWTMGLLFQPQFGYFRRTIAKFGALITVIDDIYDAYGTLEELECFTNAVERWDINAMDGLPEYMKMCFFALHNSVNELAFDILKEQGFNIIRYLKKVWADLCRTYLLEAKWYHNGYTPSLQEYIENAWISIAGPNLMMQAYFCVTNPLTSEALDCLEEYPNMVRWSSLILRLADDLGTSTDEIKREDAREYIRCMITATWKKMNDVRVASSPFSQTYIDISFNFARMAQFMYQHGDGHGAGNHETKGHILSLLIQPIPLNKNRCD